MLYTFYVVDKMTGSKKVTKHLDLEKARDLYYDAVGVYLDVDKFTEEQYDDETFEVEDLLDGEERGQFGDDINHVYGGYFAEDGILEKLYLKQYGL